MEQPNELSQMAKELKDAHAKSVQRQTKLNASNDYWQASAFKTAEMTIINANYKSESAIVSEDEKLKEQSAKCKEVRKTLRPLDFLKEQKLKAGFKLLCQAINEPTAKHELDGINISDCKNYKEAYFKAIAKATEYSQLVQDIVFGKLSAKLYAGVKKIGPIKRVEIRKSELKETFA